jgi:type II secretory pathway pseudopilin PulG
MSPSLLPQAPGASTAKTTGILSIVLGILCFPVGLVLAIVALVQHNKAKTAFAANPDAYRPVGAVGLVTAIVGLVLPVVMVAVGIIAAIAIPALLGQRARARDKASVATMTSAVADLMGEYDRQMEAKVPVAEIPAHLESKLRLLGAETKNPWNPAIPAFTYTIEVVDPVLSEVVADQAKARAVEKGVVVFVLSLPDPTRGMGGRLAGAVRLQTAAGDSPVVVKVVSLD